MKYCYVLYNSELGCVQDRSNQPLPLGVIKLGLLNGSLCYPLRFCFEIGNIQLKTDYIAINCQFKVESYMLRFTTTLGMNKI